MVVLRRAALPIAVFAGISVSLHAMQQRFLSYLTNLVAPIQPHAGKLLLILLVCIPHFTHTGLDATPMFSLAAAHPEAFTALIDCYLRSPVVQAADVIGPVEALAHATTAVLGSQDRPLEALHNTAAVAGLASAVASFAKKAALLTRAAVAMQGQAIDSSVNRAAVQFPGAVIQITAVLQHSICRGLVNASHHTNAVDTAGSSSSSGGSGGQAHASIGCGPCSQPGAAGKCNGGSWAPTAVQVHYGEASLQQQVASCEG
jgi:hypothetical protein